MGEVSGVDSMGCPGEAIVTKTARTLDTITFSFLSIIMR